MKDVSTEEIVVPKRKRRVKLGRLPLRLRFGHYATTVANVEREMRAGDEQLVEVAQGGVAQVAIVGDAGIVRSNLNSRVFASLLMFSSPFASWS